MKRRRFHFAATLAFLLAPWLGSYALAEPPEKKESSHFSAEDKAAFTDAKLAALKAGLKLSPTQEKNWPALEAALRDALKARSGRLGDWREKVQELHQKDEIIAEMKLLAKNLSAGAADLDKVADAAKPLVDSLEESQKHRFDVLLHVLFRPHMHHWRWMRHDSRSGEHDEHDD